MKYVGQLVTFISALVAWSGLILRCFHEVLS